MHPSLIDMKLLYVIWNAEVIYWHVTLSAATRVDSDKCVERVELEKAVEICEKMQLRICTRDEVNEMGSCKHRIVLVHPRSSILHQLMPTTLLHLQLPLLLVKSPWDLCLSCEYCCVKWVSEVQIEEGACCGTTCKGEGDKTIDYDAKLVWTATACCKLFVPSLHE